MKRLLYLFIVFIGTVSLLACSPDRDSKPTDETTTIPTDTTEDDEQVIEHPDILFEHDFTYLFIDHAHYKDNPLYYDASNFALFEQLFEDNTGMLDISIEAMYMKDRAELFRFIQFNPDTTELVLSHIDDSFYQVSLRSTDLITVYHYAGNRIQRVVALRQMDDGHYHHDLYRVHKDDLDTDYEHAFVFYNLSVEDLSMRNNTRETINFRDVFEWEDNALTNLQEFSNSYLIEDGERYDHGFFGGLNW